MKWLRISVRLMLSEKIGPVDIVLSFWEGKRSQSVGLGGWLGSCWMYDFRKVDHVVGVTLWKSPLGLGTAEPPSYLEKKTE